MSVLNLISRLIKEDDGATAVEYGLIVAGIAAVVAGAVMALGSTIKGKLQDTNGIMGTVGEEGEAPIL